MSIDVTAAEERLVLSQLRWGSLTPLGPEDEKICRRLEAQGLVTKIANGRWAPTASGGVTAAFGR
jgi:hypothetical protein